MTQSNVLQTKVEDCQGPSTYGQIEVNCSGWKGPHEAL